MTDLDPIAADTGEPDTADVVRHERSPDATDFDEVYRLLYAPMVRLAVSLVDRRAEAEQAVQDAFVGLYRHFDRVELPAAYVRTSVVNSCRKVLRRRRVARRHVVPDPDVTELGVDHTLDAVRRLPADQRILVALRYHQQLTDSEIASELDLPIGTVKSRLHRAIARLREELT